MIITGIVVEYNPFHNGHIYHINKAKELTNCDLLIAVTSGNFTQRGEPSVISKFIKTEAALKYGVDLVIELPYIYTVQNASIFGEYSIKLLDAMGVNNVVFGSETNNLEELKKMADLNINIDHLKEEMNKGLSYPKAYGLLSSSLYPNDILALTYLRAIKNTNINPITIQRTNDYKGLELNEIASATAIKQAIIEGKSVSRQTPIKIKEPLFFKDFYPFLRKLLIMKDKDELKEIFLVSEGIENLLIKNALKYTNYEDFLNNSISKRYTKNRIQRICLSIINNIKKEDVINLPKLDYIRVLGFNAKGQEYLKKFENEEYKIITQFKNIPSPYKDIEWRINNLYASYLNDPTGYIKEELKGPIIK